MLKNKSNENDENKMRHIDLLSFLQPGNQKKMFVGLIYKEKF